MPLIFALDTSCMVAAVCGWHQHHSAVVAEIERRLDRAEVLAVSAHALAETYAVLTRLPAPHRLSCSDAWALVEGNFVEHRRITALSTSAYTRVLKTLAKEGIGGGRTYDALIAECAHEVKATVLLTFNRRHFEPPPHGLTIIEPMT